MQLAVIQGRPCRAVGHKKKEQCTCTSVLVLCWNEKWRSDLLLNSLVTVELKKRVVTHGTDFINPNLNRKLFIYSQSFQTSVLWVTW